MSSEIDEILTFPEMTSSPRMKTNPRFSPSYEEKLNYKEKHVFTSYNDHVKPTNKNYAGGTLV